MYGKQEPEYRYQIATDVNQGCRLAMAYGIAAGLALVGMAIVGGVVWLYDRTDSPYSALPVSVVVVLGVIAGVLLFGDTVAYYNNFWSSSFMGRFTLPEMLGLDTGVVVLLLVLMALAMFWFFGLISKLVYGKPEDQSPFKLRMAAAFILVLLSVVLVFNKQPDLETKWTYIAEEYAPRLEQRTVYIDPAELLHMMNDEYIHLLIYDVRSESDWNQFHLVDAERVPLQELSSQGKRIRSLPENAVIVLVSNDEILSTRAWKHLMALAKPNAYILEGGINHWLNIYGVADDEVSAHGVASLAVKDGSLRHPFNRALGERHAASRPDEHHAPHREYTPRVKLLKKVARAGGCG